MGRVAIDLRGGSHAQQVVLPRRRNAIGRNPLNGIVESACGELDALSDERIVERQRAGLGVNAFGELRPVRIALALSIPSERELSILRQIRIGPVRGTRDLHARSEHRADGKRRRRSLVGRNGLELVLPGKRHGANGIDGLRTAVVALLLGALHRVLARGDYANVLAHHVIGRHIRSRVSRVGNVNEMAIVGALVVGVLPLIVNLVRRGDVGVGVALGRLCRQRLARGNLARCQSARDRHAVKLNGASLDNEDSARLLLTKATVGAGLNILTRIRFIGRKGIGGHAINLGGASARRVAVVPRPCYMFVGGHIARSRVGGRRDGLARVGLARFVELNLRDINGTSGTDKARALGSVVAAADLCGDVATNRLALVSRELEGIRRRTLDVGVGTVLLVRNLPLIVQLGRIDVIGGALLFSKGLDGVVDGVD